MRDNMATNDLAATIKAIRPMVPAKDFDISLRFYSLTPCRAFSPRARDETRESRGMTCLFLPNMVPRRGRGLEPAAVPAV